MDYDAAWARFQHSTQCLAMIERRSVKGWAWFEEYLAWHRDLGDARRDFLS
jgi:hypothetical protein